MNTRDMMTRWYYHDPMDVFRWVDESYPLLTLVKSGRHPQGFYYAQFRLIWDGEQSSPAIKCTARNFLYGVSGHTPPMYPRNCVVTELATKLIQAKLGRENHFQLAQSFILHHLLYGYLHNNLYPSWSSEGYSSPSGLSIELRSGYITVEQDGLVEKFTVQQVAQSIRRNLTVKPKQLKLFG